MRIWSDEATDRFAELWPTHGPSWDGWERELGFKPTARQMYYQASKLDVHRGGKGPNPYTDEETDTLVRLVEEYCRRYGRTFGSVVRKLDAIQTKRASAKRRETCEGGK